MYPTKNIGNVVNFVSLDKNVQDLIFEAVKSTKYSYTPYSQFNVGAAIRCESGRIYTGCNIESISYTPSICAERTAVAKAVSEGDKKFVQIAITATTNAPIEGFTSPCGVCRQVLAEFCDDIEIFLSRYEMDQVMVTSLKELFPLAFAPHSVIVPIGCNANREGL